MSALPGWHPDPTASQDGALRWWDGQVWTDHIARGSGWIAAAGATPGPASDPTRSTLLDDATLDHLVDGLCADYVREQRFSPTYRPSQVEAEIRSLLLALQSELAANERLLELRDVERPGGDAVDPMVVVTDRRVLVVQGTEPHADGCRVSAELHERVRLRRPSGATSTPEPLALVDEDGMTLTLRSADRRWVDGVRSGGLQSWRQLTRLLARPRRAPGAPAPDWYPDPEGQAELRFWDGTTWTRSVRGRRGKKRSRMGTPLGSMD